MVKAGTITEADKPYWDSMLSTLEKEENEKAEGLISTEQAGQADWARELLGYALDASTRAEILEECGEWLKSGKSTQSQYDAIKAYAGVLDSNDDFLKAEESERKAMEEHDALVEDIVGYIVDVAGNYDSASAYYSKYVDGGEEFSDADKRSIEIALDLRKNMDAKNIELKMTEEQSKAYDSCISLMGLYDTVEGQRKVLEQYKDRLAPELYEELKVALDVLGENPETQAVEKEAAREKDAKAKGYANHEEMVADIISGNATVEHDGKTFRLKDKPLVQYGNGTNGMGNNFELGKITEELKKQGYQRWNDVNIEDGMAITIHYDFMDGVLFKKSDTFFYYNGAWYPAKEQ
jgi:signal recognition particle GTPase